MVSIDETAINSALEEVYVLLDMLDGALDAVEGLQARIGLIGEGLDKLKKDED